MYAYVILLTFLGPEYLRRQFGVAHDDDLAEAAGHDTIEAAIHRREALAMGIVESDQEDIDGIEKGTARQAANV